MGPLILGTVLAEVGNVLVNIRPVEPVQPSLCSPVFHVSSHWYLVGHFENCFPAFPLGWPIVSSSAPLSPLLTFPSLNIWGYLSHTKHLLTFTVLCDCYIGPTTASKMPRVLTVLLVWNVKTAYAILIVLRYITSSPFTLSNKCLNTLQHAMAFLTVLRRGPGAWIILFILLSRPMWGLPHFPQKSLWH